ncbi:MAG: NUDIX domain-containing protein [Pseudomonadales bacterium]|nr:NUDIX domain-containing protein [Gammaproteobacteria bacterium]NNC55569.1 NUDIX domain-containing protein [Pseudomonadales bacterium]NNL57353.1 NUDIX domain-containing protein [Pseudomonadales bacterium]
MRFCPQCATELVESTVNNESRMACPVAECGFVLWNNPTPVVAIIVELPQGVVLAHNVAWPQEFYSIITGFLEAGEDPLDCAIRETKEELNLDCTALELVGVYPFAQQNQVIIAYHGLAHGEIKLNSELDSYKIVPAERLRPWGMGTGLALADWLRRRKQQ